MQNQSKQTTTGAAFGRSTIARLPAILREAVDAAIADGATIDEITARIRAAGGACSRSAVGRYVKDMRELIRRQQETDRANEMWMRTLGGGREGCAGLILIETLRAMTLSTMAHLSKGGEPVSTEELARLRPSGAEKEEGADTAFVPPPPFRGEGNRGSWSGLRSGPASDGYRREVAWAGYRRYGPPSASRRGPSLTQRTVAGAGACSADGASVIHKWIKRIVSYLSPNQASRAQMAGSAGM